MLLSAETRAQWAVAIVLALIAGYVDGYGLLRLGVFVSFMNGNTTTAGLRTGQGNFQGDRFFSLWPVDPEVFLLTAPFIERFKAGPANIPVSIENLACRNLRKTLEGGVILPFGYLGSMAFFIAVKVS